MVYRLLSEWCVVTSFYQSSANHVYFLSLFQFAQFIVPYPAVYALVYGLTARTYEGIIGGTV